MECQVKNNENFRHLRFAVNRGSKAAKAARDLKPGDLYQRGIENLVERWE